MAVWRACHDTDADPCTAVVKSTPACHELSTLKSGSPQYQDAASKCGKAQKADYSCHAVKNDPEYQRRVRVMFECMKKISNDPTCAGPTAQDLPARSKRWIEASKRDMACLDSCLPDESAPDCEQAQAALSDFQDRVQKAMLDAQLKEAFAPPDPIMAPYQPPPTVIIQQPARTRAFPTQTTCMPFGTGVTCNSW